MQTNWRLNAWKLSKSLIQHFQTYFGDRKINPWIHTYKRKTASYEIWQQRFPQVSYFSDTNSCLVRDFILSFHFWFLKMRQKINFCDSHGRRISQGIGLKCESIAFWDINVQDLLSCKMIEEWDWTPRGY